ncbi:GFA family protein [Stenotrophomonas rhizophila]|uniref:GFA family protein n=1 Tax=Stenotrophomonas rhizophila TaxID=216778 RepID=UPI001E3FA6C7|nr:GFA family protein [Stenotrophomonas rhizophila]MCC7635055.1 GFA family protein [Stenotrophomonas rhizophila]MCC7662568.1 GFA family protein [Stenotrophomonas rhizophila]
MQYEGSCHCGQIAFVVEATDPIAEVIDCNCSLCRRRGGLLWFAPRAALQLQTDPADVATYQFNQHHLEHHYCRSCGIAPFSEGVDPRSGQAMAAVNVRCLPGLDLAGLNITHYDGASR